MKMQAIQKMTVDIFQMHLHVNLTFFLEIKADYHLIENKRTCNRAETKK